MKKEKSPRAPAAMMKKEEPMMPPCRIGGVGCGWKDVPVVVVVVRVRRARVCVRARACVSVGGGGQRRRHKEGGSP